MNIRNKKGNISVVYLFVILLLVVLFIIWPRKTEYVKNKISQPQEISEGEELTGATGQAEVSEPEAAETAEPEAEEPQQSITIKIEWKEGIKIQGEATGNVETIENLESAYTDDNSRQLVLVFKYEETGQQRYNQHVRCIPLNSIFSWEFIGTNMREPSVF